MIRATPLQESLWWVHQRAKDKSVYNITWRMGCSHAPDIAALRIAWQAVVNRHDALRAVLVRTDDGELELVAYDELSVDVQTIEVDGPPSAELFRLIAEEVQEQPMQLDQPPLVRLAVVRIGDQYELLLTVHHVVSDGWGNQLLLTDLSQAYTAACEGRQPAFAEPALSFLDYAATSADWGKSLQYWTKSLEGTASTTVVADRQASGETGVIVRYELSDDAVTGITELSKTVMATPFIAVLAALQIVLARGGAGPDVGVGIIVANRMSTREQNLVGYTANLCMAMASVHDQDTVQDVVTQARDAMWTMFGHQSVPYPVVFGALSEATQRTLGGTPPLVLDYLGPIGSGLVLGDIQLTLHKAPNRAARTDLSVVIWETGDGFMTELEYNTGRYDQSTALNLMQDIDAVLSAAGKTPVTDLDLLTRSVPGHLDHRAAPGAPVQLPDSPVTGLVADVWQRILGQSPAAPDENFFVQGGRSLKAIQLASVIETETGIALDLSQWLTEPTPARLIELLASTVPGGTSTLVVLRDGPGPHLHLLPGACGGPQDYLALLDVLPADWRVTASQERGEYATIAEMAAAYRSDLDRSPDLLGGWSMGGQIAFELARSTPVPLVLLDPAPPVGYSYRPSFADFVAMTAAGLGIQLDVPRAGELNIPVLAAFLKHADHDVPATLLSERWATYQRHTKAVADYRPESGVDAPAFLVAAELMDVQVDQWRSMLGPTEAIRLDTDHFGLLSSIGEVAELNSGLQWLAAGER